MDRNNEDRCPGGVVGIDAFKLPSSPGWWKANCPTCGRWIAFHWSTGRFRAHRRP